MFAIRSTIPAPILIISSGLHADVSSSFALLTDTIEGQYNLVFPTPPGDARIGFYYAGADDYSSAVIAGGKIALYRVTKGAARRVGKPHRITWDAGEEITLQRRAGLVRVIADDAIVMAVEWDAPLLGQVGIAESGEMTLDDLLLQPVVDPIFSDDFTREELEMAEWVTAGGEFRNTMVQAEGADPNRSANPFSLEVIAEGEAFASAGAWFWDSYRVTTSVKPISSDTIGLCAYVLDDQNYLALHWDASDQHKPTRRLVLTHDGERRVLASSPGGFAPGQWYQLELRVSPGHIEARIDRDPALSATTDAFGQGAIGLTASNGAAVFDDVVVAALDAPDTEIPNINPVFVDDDIMAAQEVYLPRGFWVDGEADGSYWHWGRFYHDATITIPLAQLRDRELGVLIQPAAVAELSGAKVSAAVVGDRITLAAEAGAESVGSADEPVDGKAPVIVAIEGDSLTISQAGIGLLSCALPPCDSGWEIGLVNADASAIDEVTVTSDGARDYTFASGPTDWYQGKGLWDVTSRWHCQPGWTFVGGSADPNPVIWTKHSYQGDVVLEFFGAIRMEEELVGSPFPYIHPGDINAQLCGNGVDLDSGYSFAFAGWDNSKTAILRNGVVVAESSDVIIDNPTTRDAFHRHWFRIRAEKLGDTVRYWVDGQPVIEYTDPEPLEGGRVGLWTFHNDLMIARARLWHAEEERPGSVLRVPQLQGDEPPGVERPSGAPEVFNDFETDAGEWLVPTYAPGTSLALDTKTSASGGSSLRVTNSAQSGPFTVHPVVSQFRASDWPIISFDYRFSPDVKLNLYLITNGDWHVVTLTADEPDAPQIIPIGAAEIIADGKWRRAEIDLESLLKATYPQFKIFQIRELVLSPPWSSYTRCGIGGNGGGTQYWIDNFHIGPRE